MIKHWENYSLENIQEEIDGVLYTEEWKPVTISDFSNLYLISSFGRIKGLKNNIIRKQILVDEGYLRINLSNGINNVKFFFCHILTALAFVSNPIWLPEVNHKKGIKTDNRFLMLEWSTRRGNIIHAFETGLSKTGENHGKSKLTNSEALEIYNQPNEKRKILSKKYNISEATIKKIRNGTSWNYITSHANKIAV